MAKRKRRSPRRLRPELLLDARELENVVFQCGACPCRIEVTPDSEIREDAACPSCGRRLAEEHRLFKLYADAYEELFRAPGIVHFRIHPRGRFPIPSERRRP